MFENLRARFFGRTQDFAVKPPTTDVGIMEDSLLAGYRVPAYNPDFVLNKRGYAIYDEMLRDEQVKAVYRFRRNTTTGRRWEFEYDDEEISQIGEAEAERRVKIMTLAVKNMDGSFKQAMDKVMTAMAYGYSLTNKVFELFKYEGQSYYGIKRLRRKPQYTFDFYADPLGNIERVVQTAGGQRKEVDLNRFIYYVCNPDVNEIYGRSELHECHRAWYSKSITINFLNIHMERAATGFNYAELTGDNELVYGTPAYNRFQSALASIRNATSLIMPKGYKLTSVQAKPNDAHINAIATHDKAIAKGFLVPNLLGLSEQGNYGGNAQSTTQLEAFIWMLDSDATGLAEVLEDQLFWELGELNFGDGVYPHFCLLRLSQSQVNEVVKVWKDLVTAGAVEASDTDEEFIREQLGMPDKGEPLKKSQPVAIDPNTGLPVQQPPGADGNNPPGSGQQPPGKTPTQIDQQDETIAGKKLVSIEYAQRFSAAIRRVDFGALDRKSDLIALENTHLLAEAMSKALQNVLGEIRDKKLGTDEGRPEDVAKLQFRAEDVKAVRDVAASVLKAGWALGTTESAKELKVSLQRQLPAKSYATLADLSAKYFNTKSFMMAGNLTDKAKALIKNILMNGIRYSKTTEQVEQEIYQKFAKEGLITKALAEQALGAALGVEDPSYRLATVIKTNTFEAINEARYAFFRDPDLGGFVEALEYSAVMDDRTTDVCRALDGHIHAVDSTVWDEGFRPPNHYNCRSVLVPVLRGDQWQESPEPTVPPQEGFG